MTTEEIFTYSDYETRAKARRITEYELEIQENVKRYAEYLRLCELYGEQIALRLIYG